VRIHKINHVNFEIDLKWGSCNNILNQLHVCHPHRIWATRIKENNLKEQKNKEMNNLGHYLTLWFSNLWAPKKWATLDPSLHFVSFKPWATKKWATLDPSLHFGSPNHELFFKLFLFGSEPTGFPPKWCHIS
jgi:hypothetical protein